MAALIFIQYLLFRQQVIREMLGVFPANHDQVNFLGDSLTNYFNMLDRGFWRGLLSCFDLPRVSSPLLAVQGALVFYFFGPERLNVLTLIFAYFALLQVAVVHAVRRLTGGWPLSFLALGLLIGTISRFHISGGLSDFRADAIASSMYGVTLCCFLLSGWMRNEKWSRLTVYAAALLCWLRPIAGAYLAVIAASLMLVSLPWDRTGGRVRSILRYGATFAGLTLPMVVLCWRTMYSYYVVGHVVGPEKSIRAAEQGVYNSLDNLLYYPKTLQHFHIGGATLTLWIFLLLASGALVLFARWRYLGGGPESPTFRGRSWRPAMLILWLVTPLAILTMDESKSPLVGSIAVGPAALVGAYAIGRVLAAAPEGTPAGLRRVFQWGLASFTLLVGMTFMANAEARRGTHPHDGAAIKALLRGYEKIATYCEYFDLPALTVATDRTLDYFSGHVASYNVFERTKYRVRTKELLAENIFSRTTQEAEEAARRADIALVTLDSPERLHHSLFPFDRSAAQWQSAYREIVTRTMIPIERVNLAGHNFQIYARPRVRIDGEPDGWITAAGVDIRVKTALLRVWPLLRVQGKTAGSKYLAGPLQGKLTIAGLPPGMTVPARVNIAPDESYEIEADLSGVAWPDRQIAEMHLSFDRFFIPQAMGLSSDSRKLVIQLPSSNYLTNRDGIAPAELSVRELFLDPP